MAKLIGTAPNQVPTNGDLGTMAFEDAKNYATRVDPIYQPYRNLIINGDMRIAQRGTSTTGLQYNNDNNFPCCDRWMFSQFGSSSYNPAFTGSQDTDVPTGQGFVNSFKLACTTADATLEADSAIVVRQMIEAQNLTHLKYGTSSAEKITASFWVKSNVTGTYTLVFNQVDALKYYGADYTINTADTWEKKTITIDGNTSDVINNDNGIGFRMDFYLSVGSNYAGGTNEQWTTTTTSGDVVPNMTNNIGGSTSNYINITGVQLEVGDTATPFEHRPWDMELARCQRYFCTSYDYGTTVGSTSYSGSQRSIITSSSGRNGTFFIFPVSMRIPPNVTTYSPATGAAGKTRRENDSTDRDVTWIGARNLGFNIDTTGTTSDCMIMQWKAEAEL